MRLQCVGMAFSASCLLWPYSYVYCCGMRLDTRTYRQRYPALTLSYTTKDRDLLARFRARLAAHVPPISLSAWVLAAVRAADAAADRAEGKEED